MKRLIGIVSLVALAACSESQKQAWRESGHSWAGSGKQTARALGESVNPDATDRKGEWKQVGQEFKEAGKDTGRALGDSVTPPPDETTEKRK